MQNILAVLDADTIVNTIVGHSDKFPQHEDITDLVPRPGIGWTRIAPGQYAPPPVQQPPEPEKRWITGLAFWNRFTLDERTELDLQSIDPGRTATRDSRRFAATLRDMKMQVTLAGHIDLDRQDTRTQVMQIEAALPLASGRALQILDAPVQEHERARG